MKTISRPVINRLPVDVNQLDEFACRQLDRVSRSFLELLFFSFFFSATIAKKKDSAWGNIYMRPFFKLGYFSFPPVISFSNYHLHFLFNHSSIGIAIRLPVKTKVYYLHLLIS